MLGKMMGLGGNPLYDAFDQRRNTLMGVGAGLLSGNWGNMGQYAMQGRQMDDAYATQQKAEAQRQDSMNKTVQAMLEAGREDLANMAESGFMEQAWRGYLDHVKQQNGGGDERFFGNVVPMEDENGNIIFGQVSNQGNWQPLRGAEGMSPAPTTKTQDIGTHIITYDVYGNELFRTPKDNYTPAYDSALGTGEGKTDAETIAAAESLASKMPGLKAVVAELGTLAEAATYTQTGKLWDDIVRETGQMPSEGALARTKYMAMVDNQVLPLLRDIFGAAFTVQEGESLRATLGAPDKSPQEKKAVLEAFIEQKVRDLEALQSRVPSQGGASGVDLKTKYGLE